MRLSVLTTTTLLLLAFGPLAPAADWEREERIADEIIDAILDGDPIELKDGQRGFLTIEMATNAETPRGAAIILHGRGLHPDWERVAQPLRVGLTEQGWHTLSLQMPVLDKQATYNDYVPLFPEAWPRLDAAVAHLREAGFQRIALIAHSCGGHMAMSWLEARGDQSIHAFVGIDMGATDYQQKMAKPFAFEQLRVPVLDVYGSDDYPAVRKMAPNRWEAIQKAGHSHSAQHELKGADHYAVGHDKALLNTVSEWLARLP